MTELFTVGQLEETRKGNWLFKWRVPKDDKQISKSFVIFLWNNEIN